MSAVANEDHRSDAELLRASATDAAAFRTVYDRHAPVLLSSLRAHLHDDEAAADLLAETFAQAWIRAGTFRDERDGSARPWLFGIARNLVLESHRKQRIETRARVRLGMAVRDVAIDVADDVVDRLDAEARGVHLRDALARLPPLQRRAVELRILAELPYATVARQMNSSEAHARVRVMRGLGALRRLLASKDH